jgi:hypothetical protein
MEPDTLGDACWLWQECLENLQTAVTNGIVKAFNGKK